MVPEKIQALRFCKKPRDFFDLHFLLRQRLRVDAIFVQKKHLLHDVKELLTQTIRRDLKVFPPMSHHQTILQLPKVLQEELRRL
jgi:hypothetical protein